MLRSFTSSETKESPLKDKYVTLIVERGTTQSQKSLTVLYRASASSSPRWGGWSLDSGEGEAIRGVYKLS